MQLPIARYRFECVATDEVRMPFYSGSALRGAFGYMLRKVTCMTKQPVCDGCPLRRTCPYGQVFEPEAQTGSTLTADQTPPAYILEPLPIGQRDLLQDECFSFNLVLIGEARNQLALLIYVWEQVLAQGLRKPAGKARLLRVDWQKDVDQYETIYQPGKALIPHSAHVLVPPIPDDTYLNIEFLTPSRIRSEGSRLGKTQIQPADMLKALNRRYRILFRQYLLPDLPILPVQQVELHHDYRELHWLDWTRYSSRQEQEMTLGGLVGFWQWSLSDVADWWPLLFIGQWLHVGKNAAFGMGHYQLSTSSVAKLSRMPSEGLTLEMSCE